MSKCSCGRPKNSFHLACPDCWALVPRDLQHRVYDLYRKARGSPEHVEAVREAFHAIHQGRMTPKAGRKI